MDKDGVLAGDQSTVTGAEHSSPVTATKPSALSFFMTLLLHTLDANLKTIPAARL
jgi:hypothetical protein